jgi:hypothetical protein
MVLRATHRRSEKGSWEAFKPSEDPYSSHAYLPGVLMSDTKRPQQGDERPKKKRFRSVRESASPSDVLVSCHDAQDGTPIWGKRSIDGPGIWISCVKGKEKQTVGELYDLFESVGRAASYVRGLPFLIRPRLLACLRALARDRYRCRWRQ